MFKVSASLFLSLVLSAGWAFADAVETRKVFDGMSVHCQANQDLNNKGFFLDGVQAQDLGDGMTRIFMSPNFVKCTNQGWQSISSEQFLNYTVVGLDDKVYSVQGTAPEVLLVDTNWQTYRLMPLDKNVAIDVRSVDFMTSQQQEQLKRDGRLVLQLDVSLRSHVMYSTEGGESTSMGYRTTGAFRLYLHLEMGQDGLTVTSVEAR
ncbi:hypothetical protein EZJ49_13690 [Bdellovibrio bacteriovorus]|uniref:hypothetical protein n=1 Tax=Bdellovibrio bacteriovorus TaxID=959 RepID=UPI0021D150A1|nr:hypothetical protein [Bdellovibrio bacteriovorus]UXR64114.1 hypothetical protein EZJ49_13690 [Bdellovibrio bacteriovorus]